MATIHIFIWSTTASIPSFEAYKPYTFGALLVFQCLECFISDSFFNHFTARIYVIATVDVNLPNPFIVEKVPGSRLPIALAGKVKQSIAFLHPSVCLSVRLFPLYILNRLNFEFEFLHMYALNTCD